MPSEKEETPNVSYLDPQDAVRLIEGIEERARKDERSKLEALADAQLNALLIVANEHYYGGEAELRTQMVDAIEEVRATLTPSEDTTGAWDAEPSLHLQAEAPQLRERAAELHAEGSGAPLPTAKEQADRRVHRVAPWLEEEPLPEGEKCERREAS